ncbi:DUF2508 family protein [Secundilactobacillus kimchicus]|uniref:DUF2508 domain-containing protein n=1 Tax=Secundilactobacillus kimchicus JCM 15530 TaxID=1302272 RepID=A0A0R1HU32_9LACO|nr:YaaL family protein [Secundilactobacillus kimchicus]KRK48035.1 hypothetical protein FC96_GL001764 [Secundilactobacillus kimchicus JCM 15530]MBT9671000.1 DUF2508 family protein [Secundilactobacillus kimchicus]
MFGSKKQRLRHEFDDKLLDAIERAKQEWDQAKETEIAVADVDVEMTSQTALARQKYLFLYREARRRQVRGKHIQASVFDY